MWYEHLDRTKFLHMLYDEIPALENVRIGCVKISDEGNKAKIVFDMPRYADNPPKKWEGYNIAIIEMYFFGIKKIEISATDDAYRGNISIDKNSKGQVELKINGSLNLNIVSAGGGLIQHISAYFAKAIKNIFYEDGYIEFVNQEALKQTGKYFFLNSGEGREIEYSDKGWLVEDLSGWLVDKSIVDDFAKLTRYELYRREDVDLVFAIWEKDSNNTLKINFKKYY